MQGAIERYVRELIPFVAVVVQFGLIVLVVRDWQLESLSLSRLMDLAFVGFIIHHLLPLRFHLPFFAVLSMAAVIAVVGAGLAFLRAHSQRFPDVRKMWVILGSMFMFRLMIYLYDLKGQTRVALN